MGAAEGGHVVVGGVGLGLAGQELAQVARGAQAGQVGGPQVGLEGGRQGGQGEVGGAGGHDLGGQVERPVAPRRQ